MSFEERVVYGVTEAVSRRSFVRRAVGWGATAGIALSGTSSLLTKTPAWAITCSETDNPNNGVCYCTTCGTFCSGCNGSENADGCPSGYDADLTCAYVETGCWCTKNCCVKRADGTYQRRRRTCCDCTNNSDLTDRCTCRGKKQWGALCNQSQWQLDGLIEDESITDATLWGPS